MRAGRRIAPESDGTGVIHAPYRLRFGNQRGVKSKFPKGKHVVRIFSPYGIDAVQDRPNDKNWTGAEIKACCRLSVLLDQSLVEAATNVVPVAVTAAESIDKLRQWAGGRCLDASAGGIYGGAKKPPRRRSVQAVGPRPSDN